VFTFYSVLELTCDQDVLADLQEITKQVAAQAALDSLWCQLKVPAPVSKKPSKKRRSGQTPVVSSPASTSSRRNDAWVGLFGLGNDEFTACTPLATPPHTDYTSSSDCE
jgi:hypothetical protein